MPEGLRKDGVFRAYYVWPAFPSISISGSACGLQCKHCNRQYLSHMHPATTGEELIELARRLQKAGAKGVLLSGGCDKEGIMLNLRKLLPAINKLHEMGLIIKLHTGFVDRAFADEIVASGVDIASMEFVGSQQAITEIFQIDKTPEDYLQTFINLRDAGMPHIAPHIAVGLLYGDLSGELDAITMLHDAGIPLSSIAIIVFRPTKNTALEGQRAPEPDLIAKVVGHARELYPDSKIFLGAMRPRSSGRNDPDAGVRHGIEIAAYNAGIDGMEIPSNHMLDVLKKDGLRTLEIQAYGVLPREYEEKVEVKWI